MTRPGDPAWVEHAGMNGRTRSQRILDYLHAESGPEEREFIRELAAYEDGASLLLEKVADAWCMSAPEERPSILRVGDALDELLSVGTASFRAEVTEILDRVVSDVAGAPAPA